MALIFSQPWAEVWRKSINASRDFRRSGERWRDDIVFVMSDGQHRDGGHERAVYLNLEAGECTEAREAVAADLERASFVIAANAATWRRILAGRLDLVIAIMRGKFTLRRGTLASLLPHASAGHELLATVRDVPTEIPD